MILHLTGVEREDTATTRFCLVHGGVGGLDEFVQAGTVLGREGDTNAAADVHGLVVELVGLSDLADQALGKRVEFLVLAYDQDDKLVAAEARQRVAVAQFALQALRHQAQQFVALLMAQGVVDMFELVQVDEENRELRLDFPGSQGSLAKATLQQQPIGQPRQGIEVGQAHYPLFGLYLSGHVFHHRDEVLDIALVIAYRRDGAALRVELAVLAGVPELPGPVSLCQQAVPQRLVKRLVLATRLQHARVAANCLFARMARDPGEGRVDVEDPSLRIGDDDRLMTMLEHFRGELESVPVRHHVQSEGDIAGQFIEQPYHVGIESLALPAEYRQDGMNRLAIRPDGKSRHGSLGMLGDAGVVAVQYLLHYRAHGLAWIGQLSLLILVHADVAGRRWHGSGIDRVGAQRGDACFGKIALAGDDLAHALIVLCWRQLEVDQCLIGIAQHLVHVAHLLGAP
ncbi:MULTISPECIES: hypothetical protein [Halomonadaceae]|uniref:hypothetical protein n=1 Tax=Halomonas sp. MCCC 1A11057 TaxID=2733482 RepID=UPI001F41977F|nr:MULTISPECIES: hypothetical protein [Halomonas]